MAAKRKLQSKKNLDQRSRGDPSYTYPIGYTSFSTGHCRCDRALLGSDMLRQTQRAREGPFAGGAYHPGTEVNGPNMSWNIHPPQFVTTPCPRTLNNLSPWVLVSMHIQMPPYGPGGTIERLSAWYLSSDFASGHRGRSGENFRGMYRSVLRVGRVYMT